jgi:hypothetical protein
MIDTTKTVNPDNFCKPWCFRPGEITSKDKAAIRGLTEVQPLLVQFFLTGEMSVERLGDIGARALLAANDTVDEPLFVLTYANTIRMQRFDASAIWPLINQPALHSAVGRESAYLGCANHRLVGFDFYYSLLFNIGFMDRICMAAGWRATYYNALTLFRKSGYLGISVTEFFSAHDRDQDKYMGFHRMEPYMSAERDRVWSQKAVGLTNGEMNFLSSIK